MGIKGTKTEQNLKSAFAGESQARNKYTYYSQIAQEEGKTEISELFERMSANELSHAKIWFNMLYPKKASMTNLIEAATGEGYEWHDMYPNFAKTAREEGFLEIADMFDKVATIERSHEKTFMQMIAKASSKNPEALKAQEDSSIMNFRCIFCGNETEHRPDVCPVCKAIGAFDSI